MRLGSEVTGIGGFILLVLSLWAIISTVSSRASTGRKLVWVLLILFLPLLGFILWLFLGPRAARG